MEVLRSPGQRLVHLRKEEDDGNKRNNRIKGRR